jgi:hypothetical protein
MGGKLIRGLRPCTGRCEHVAARHVERVFERDRDRVAGVSGGDRTARSENGGDAAPLLRRKRNDVVADAYDAACERAAEAAEIGIRPMHPLHRQTERLIQPVVLGVDAFKIGEQMRPMIPGRPLALGRDVIAVARRQQDRGEGFEAERAGEIRELVCDLFELRRANNRRDRSCSPPG